MDDLDVGLGVDVLEDCFGDCECGDDVDDL